MDFGSGQPVVPPLLSSFSAYVLGDAGALVAGISAASGSWPASNKVLYYPLWLPWPYLVRRVFWVNGSTPSSNVDIGVYALDGARLFSIGSTAQSGASALQFAALGTPFLLSPGRYYMAFGTSGTTSRVFGGNVSVPRGRAAGIVEELSAMPLPASMTPAVLSSATAVGQVFGLTNTDSGF